MSKRIKTLLELAGKVRPAKERPPCKPNRIQESFEKPFERPDGTIGKDKSRGQHSRPGAKAAARQVNRSQNKRARQILKRQLELETP